MTRGQYFDKGSDYVFELGERATKVGDRDTYDACLKELERRKGALARELADELSELWPGGAPLREGRTLWPGNSLSIRTALTQVSFVWDKAIIAERDEMIRSAQISVWLSTFQYRDDDDELTELLAHTARRLRPDRSARIEVRLFASKGPAKRDRPSQQFARLRRAHVDVCTEESTHSKCVVIDHEHVMLGSANLNTTFRDAVLRFRSPEVAGQIEAYLSGIAARADRK